MASSAPALLGLLFASPSVSPAFIHYIQQRLSLAEALELPEEEAHRVRQPPGRVVGTMGGEQYILQSIKRVARRQRLTVEDIESRALNPAFFERLHEGCLVDHRAALDIHQHRGLLHGAQFRRGYHA